MNGNKGGNCMGALDIAIYVAIVVVIFVNIKILIALEEIRDEIKRRK